MAEKMMAALMYGPGDIRVEETEKPACPDGGYVLRIEAVGLCGSDIRNMSTDSRSGKYPWIYGHEATGVVDEVSPTCTEYKKGERLYVYPAPVCSRCENCLSGLSAYCTDRYEYTQRPGAYAQYIAFDAERVRRGAMFRIPEHIDFVTASLGEPMSSVYACQDAVNVSLQDTIVVIGAGPIGCFHSRLAKKRGAACVIMIDINDKRLALSKRYDVDYTINSAKTDPVEEVRKITGGRGADKVISANPSAEAQNQALYMARKGGIVVFFGGIAKGKKAELDTNYVHYNSLWLYGHYATAYIHPKKAFELICDPSFRAREFVTHVLPLKEINKGIEMTRTGEAIKVVLEPWK
jgi:L-iditol 2-dehydrogenase